MRRFSNEMCWMTSDLVSEHVDTHSSIIADHAALGRMTLEDGVVLSCFPLRSETGPEDARHCASVVEKNPAIVIDLLKQACREISQQARNDEWGDPNDDYTFGDDLIHSFTADVGGRKVPLLFVYNTRDQGYRYPTFTLFSRDAR